MEKYNCKYSISMKYKAQKTNKGIIFFLYKGRLKDINIVKQ
jgi:hypothetical protein